MKVNGQYLVVKGCAGLGNRLVSVFAAIQYCKSSGRTLIVDWRDGQFDVKGSDAFSKCFEVSGVPLADAEELEGLTHLSQSSELFRANPVLGVYDLYFEKHSGLLSRVPVRFLPSVLKKIRRRWIPLKKRRLHSSLFFGSDLPGKSRKDVLYFIDQLPFISYDKMPSVIRLRQDIQEKIDGLAVLLGLNEAVGVHVRNTDKVPTKHYKRMILHLKEKFSGRVVFLATDSAEVEKEFSAHLPGLVTFDKMKPALSGEGLHQWALYNFKDDLKFRLYKESVIEMFLLSRCKTLFYQGNSTFSNISKVYLTKNSHSYDWLHI